MPLKTMDFLGASSARYDGAVTAQSLAVVALAGLFLVTAGCRASAPRGVDASALDAAMTTPDDAMSAIDGVMPAPDGGLTSLDAAAISSDAASPLDAGDAGGCREGAPCGPASPCERGVIACRGDVPVCTVGEPAAAGTLCRPALSLCDLEERCDGVSRSCPDDTFVASGTDCEIGRCDGCGGCGFGVCISDALCDSGVPCQVGRITCALCEVPVCGPPYTLDPLGSGCTDGDACTTGDVCDASGNCVGTPICG